MPKLDLEVRIKASAVNRAVREVNGKKTAALRLDVKLSTAQINREIRKINASKKLAPIKVEADLKGLNKDTVAALKKMKGTILTEEKILHKSRLAQWTAAEKDITKRIKAEGQERLNQWKFFSKKQDEADRNRIKSYKAHVGKVRQIGRGLKGLFNQREIGEFAASFIIVRSALNQIKLSALITAVGFLAEAASAAAAGVTMLASALSFAAIGGIGVATSNMLALGQAVKVLSFSFEGVSDALGGLNKQLDPKKFNRLTPAAKDFAKQLEGVKGQVRGLQQVLQEQLFTGLAEAVRVLIPLAKQFVPQLQLTARILGELGLAAAKAVGPLSGQLQTILVTNNILIRNMGQAAISLADSFVRLAAAVAPFSAIMSFAILQLTQTFNQFIRSKEASGELSRFFGRAIAAVSIFGSVLFNTGKILVNIFRAALPSGIGMLTVLEDITDRLAEFTALAGTQNRMAQFFEAANGPLREAGLLLKDLGKAFLELGSQPGLIVLLQELRNTLLPVLVPAIEKITAQLGPKIVKTLTQALVLFTTLASSGGPANLFITAVGNLLTTVNSLIKEFPVLSKVALTFVGVLVTMEALFGAIKLSVFITRMTGVSTVLRFVAGSLIAATANLLGFNTVMGITLSTSKVLIGTIGLLAGATVALGAGMIYLYKHNETAAHIMDGFSDGVLRGLSATLSLIPQMQVISDLIDSIRNKAFGEIKEVKVKKPYQANEQQLQRRRIQRAQSGVSPRRITNLTRAQKLELQYRREALRIQKIIKSIGVPDDLETPKATTAANEAAKAIRGLKASASSASNLALDQMKTALTSLEAPLERQKTLVDALKESIEALKNVQIKGSKAFDDQKFALDQQTKALQLQQVQLKLGGATDEDSAIVELQKQIDALGLAAQQVDLQESLQLDPLRRKLDETFNPIKELSFENIISQFKQLTQRHDAENRKLTTLQTGYDFLKAKIEGTEQAARKLSHTFNAQIASLPKDATTGGAAAGAALISGLQTGIGSQLQTGTDFHKTLKDIGVFIKENKGPIEYDRGLLVPAGMAIMDGLNKGLRRGFEPVKGYLRSVGPQLEEYVPDSVFAKRTAEFLVEVAAGKKPDPATFFGTLGPQFGGGGGGIMDPRLGFMHQTQSIADTAYMAKSLAKTFGLGIGALGPPDLSRLYGLPGHSVMTTSGNISNHTYGYAADLSGPRQGELYNALKGLGGELIRELIYKHDIWKNGDKGYYAPTDHFNHVHVAFQPSPGFSIASGKIGLPMVGAIAGNSKQALLQIIHAAAEAYGASGSMLAYIAKRESGLRVHARNNWDSNARAGTPSDGLFQFIQSTFNSFASQAKQANPKAWAGVPFEWLNPKAQALAAAWAFTHGHSGDWSTARGINPMLFLARNKFRGFRAMGGPVMGGNSAYMVGEKGPELFFPRSNGMVMSNKDVGQLIGLLKEIRDTGGLRQHSTTIQTASQDPKSILAMLEAQKRRKLSGVRL